MNIRTAKIILLVFAVAIVLFAIFAIYPIVSDIQEKSEELILHKKSRAELILRKDELVASKGAPLPYPLTGSIEPLDFIEFLENEAAASNLSIKITSIPSKQEDPWLSSGFGFNLSGSSSDFLTFLEKLEFASYLINISSFNILKGRVENTIQVSLSGQVYGKVF